MDAQLSRIRNRSGGSMVRTAEEGVHMHAEHGMSRRYLLRLALAAGGVAMSGGIRTMFAQAPFTPPPIAPPPGYLEAAEKALAEPFKGITTDGTIVPGLFSIQHTGVPTTPITDAAVAF